MTTPSSVLLPPGGERILVVIAHPDDAESFCGGTMARLAAEGRAIHYLVLTRGEKGSDDPAMTPEHLSIIREEEQRQAAQILQRCAKDLSHVIQ
jgi:LmbE family N-acetylglucosaminyl deacetylase